MKTKNWILVLFAAGLMTAGVLSTTLFSSCTVLQQAVALKDCKYAYSRMSDVTFMDMKTTEMATFAGAAKLAMGLLGNQPAPLGFTIHLKVTNPNQTTAAMESLYYKVSLDSVEVAEGTSMEPFMVVGGGEADLPLKISTDMKNLLQSDKRATMTKVIRNLVGVANEPTDVTVLLKPTIRVGNAQLTSPVFIPVKFVYSGRQTATY